MLLTISHIPPSNNKFIGRNAVWDYREAKQEWHWLIKAAIRERPKEPYQRAAVSIMYYFPNRIRRDPDNFSGKMILDPLVREGIIKDDSFYNITLTLSAAVDRINPRVEVEIIKI